MDYKVIISPRAIQDLSQIVRYISFDDPKAARAHWATRRLTHFGPPDSRGR